MRSARLALALAVSLLLPAALAVTPADAGIAVRSFTVIPSLTQAGGHPNLRIAFSNTTRVSAPTEGGPCHCNDPRDVLVQTPPGLIANVHATPQCTAANFARNDCPDDSQVGVVTVKLVEEHGAIGFRNVAVYNLIPQPGQPGVLAWQAPEIGLPVYTVLSARTGGDYGLDALTSGITHSLALEEYEEELWGVPADPSHDPLRYPDPSKEVFGPKGGPSDSPLTPFLQNPTRCAGPLTSTLLITAYDETQATSTSTWPATTGCDQLSFDPSLSAQPTTAQTDSPSGLEVDLKVPQVLSPTTPSQSEIRATTVVLPEGFSINPNAADGKASCSEAQAQLGPFASEEAAQCPEFAKVGTVSITSAALPGPIPGSIYIGEPTPADRYRIFIVADGFATHVKLAGVVTPDPHTGRLTATFENLPQSPLTEIDLHFFGSERGLLATPTQCGTYAVHSFFKPWDEALAEQESTQFFTLDSGPGGSACPTGPRPFGPGFAAGSTGNAAGLHAPFWLKLIRLDGEQDLSALDVTTPPGLLATLRGVPYCPQSALEAAAGPAYSGLREGSEPSCPSESQIGIATAGAGAGTHPVYLPGRVYLSGPYQGAPLSLAVITPAVSGPYDLGNVVVRVALRVDPETAQITAVSDPLPQILEGIPLRLRSVLIELDRENFTLNPTDCEPLSISAAISGAEGATATRSTPFQAANCSVLPFAPKFAARLTGSTNHTGYPSLHTVLTYPKGGPYSNVARVTATLPHSEFLAQSHLKNPCLKAVFAEGSALGQKCPPDTDIGFAKAESPLLEKPLEGPVYLRTAPGRHLPDIVAALNGQIDVALVGHVESVPGKLRTTFETVPDAPVSRFTLTLDGGSKGLISNSENLCAATQHVSIQITAQSGKTANQNPVLETPCAKKHRKPKHTRHRRANQGARR